MEEKSKEQLEIEKLKIQIENEKKPLYKKFSFYSSLAPIAVAIIAVVFSISTGFFESESRLLDLRKENLKYEISLFINQKDSLLTSISNLTAEKDSIFSAHEKLREQNNRLEILSKELIVNQIELDKTIKNTNDSIYTKQKEYNDLFDKYGKLNNDKTLLATKMKELGRAIRPQLYEDEETKILFTEILDILDESLGGFSSTRNLLLFFSD